MSEPNVLQITHLARAAASKHALPLEVVGALPTEGSDYVEILVKIEGDDEEPRLFAMGVLRGVPETQLQDEIANRLRRGLNSRSTSG